jgi:hypothetical protein
LIAKLASRNFAVGVAWQFLDEQKLARLLIGTEAKAAMGNESGFRQIVTANNSGSNLLALREFGEAHYHYVAHPLMFSDHGFDLGMMNIDATTNDEVRTAD